MDKVTWETKDNKLIELTLVKITGEEHEKANKEKFIRREYFLNVETLKVELGQWMGKRMSF